MSLIATEEVAGASCAMPVSIGTAMRQADVVVVGTVVSTRSRGRVAKVQVEDVWKGDADDELEVFGGPESEDTITSVDRTYKPDTRYLLFAYEPAAHGSESPHGGRYLDSSCSRSQPYTRNLAEHRPAGARRIELPPAEGAAEASTPASHSGDTPAAWWLLLGVVGSAVAVAAAVMIRRKWRREWDSNPR